PQWIQVHRWRYAFPKTPLQQNCLPADTSSPLVCCGDWCGGNLVESAILSGIAAAEHINSKLQQRELPGINFLDVL
ncbi:MAG: FAD-dependent oxidoreductase, partial [Cyanobacteria bacterium J06629_18]